MLRKERADLSELPQGDEPLEVTVVELTKRLLRKATESQTAAEFSHSRQMAGMIANPAAKGLAMAMTDRLIRSRDPRRTAGQYRRLLARFGIPSGFALGDRLMLAAGAIASTLLPGAVMSAVHQRLRRDSRAVILPAEPHPLAHYLAARRAMGWRVNVNPLGEAVLGEEEASRRLDELLALLGRDDDSASDSPHVDYVSVKISSIFSQINLVAWDDTLRQIQSRLRLLYRAAAASGKFVNLDMEEYRDLALTVTAFRKTLDEPEFQTLSAGIVLQAYLPDSWAVQQDLTQWAEHRTAAGGAPIKIRLVKGANLAMERVESEWHGWNAAPYESKQETDANFRRMIEYACERDHANSVRVGVGSHNLFDIALTLVLRDVNGVLDEVGIEMLEGMANHQARAVRDAASGLLVYAPIVHESDFGSALAYLIRRLDENTATGNFLSDLFAMTPESPAWEKQKARFLDGWDHRHRVSSDPRRQSLPPRGKSFGNEPDTDWTQERHRFQLIRATQVEGKQSSPQPAGLGEVDRALEIARAAQAKWEAADDAIGAAEARAATLRQCAEVLAARRFETIALLMVEGKKTVAEADTEVSEAIDFARYYASTGRLPDGEHGRAIGVVVVTPPWNFPFAIPCGGVLAALMAGNSVILKPAPETIRTGVWLTQMLWDAGVPREVLQVIACADGEVAAKLIRDARVDGVVLTGAYETARTFQTWRPSLTLVAETSGKNAMVITSMADRELAVKDLVRSAFGHSGQKCSAASLAILEAEVHDDPAFLRQLRDAASSLRVGDASDLASVVTPLIREPGEALLRALTTLDEGEQWLLEPKRDANDPCLWSPGIKLGIRPGSWFHHTECFGPVLGLMRARDLSEAIGWQNAVPFGLTAGIHSLDESEIARWCQSVEAGNLYVNRSITGAIVQRQPFGGWKRSSIGPGAKAGGPNYVQLFRRWDPMEPSDIDEVATSYRSSWDNHFSREHDPAGLRCERNRFRYRTCGGVLLRLVEPDRNAEHLARLASDLTGTPLEISSASLETDDALARRLPEFAGRFTFFRSLQMPTDELLAAVHRAGLNWVHAPFAATGRIELTRWLREQTLTQTWHRYGNLFSN